MIYTVANFKGGVSKTTTAIQLAAFLQTLAPTVLFDGDSTRSAIKWAERRKAASGLFPYTVASDKHAAKLAREYEHVVMDSGQKPTEEDLQAMAEGCHLMIVPTVPSFLEAAGLGDTIRALQQIECANFKVLLTRVPPDAAAAATLMRQELAEAGVPVFAAEIPRLKAFEKAAREGLIVSEVKDPNAGRAWAAYEAVGKELGL